MKTSFWKKQGVALASFALVFAALSACGDSSSTSSNEKDLSLLDEDSIEQTESSSSESDEDISSSEESSTENVKKSSSSKSLSSESKEEASSSETSSSGISSSEKVKVSSSSENSSSESKVATSSSESLSSESSKESSSSVVTSSETVKTSSSSEQEIVESSSSVDFSSLLSSSSAFVPIDTLEDVCEPEGAIRFYMVGKKQKIYETCHDGKWVEMGSSSSTAEDTHIAMDSLFNPEVSYGTVTDERDGQTYKTIVIERNDGKIEYFAQNLNYGEQVSANAKRYEDSVVEKYCYNDDPWFCDNGWGGLYTWSEAMGLPRACDSVMTGTTAECPAPLITGTETSTSYRLQIQGICPEGWHILNEYEWNRIDGETYAGDLITRIYGNQDKHGFSLLPAGLLNVPGHLEYEMLPRYGYLWLPEECGTNCGSSIVFNLVKRSTDGKRLKKNGMSIRCVKNYKVQ